MRSWDAITQEETQVINLLLMGCNEPQIAHILETSLADIEDRIMGIKGKWKLSDEEKIISAALERGYRFYQLGN